ncbi:hypothetical protein [Jannaschia sp. W003]|uniref:hypothetical protein n=1 Tax=Jannaschia sp. W003 TaxID=2867012 RepID=UPI0021A62018|nr:hypothetical protein [Jannaschia sp. W003]UWQ21299.1 hypothetical protein K3554_15210 [Jannaschia sp. W003]
MRRFLDLRHPMFRPLWARVLAVAVVGGWAAVELLRGAPVWAAVFAAAAGWMAWSLLIRWEGDGGDD